MSEEALFNLARTRFAPGMKVLVPDGFGGMRSASVDQIVRGLFNGAWGLGLMVWHPGVIHSDAYELSWAVEHIQVVAS